MLSSCTYSIIMAPQSFVICNHSCPHSQRAMMKSKRADALRLCYVFPYPPCAGILDHVDNLSFHPFCNNICDAQKGAKFINVDINNLTLQYWLPTLLSCTGCPPGYNTYSISCHMTGVMPGLWVEQDDDTLKGM